MSGYIEKVLWSILKSSFSKKAFCYLLISLTSLLFRTHVDALISFIIITPYQIINFLTHIVVSLFLIINSKYFYDIVHRYEPEFYSLVKYLIDNYTEKNFKRWKRKINMFICIYVYILTYIMDFSNGIIRHIIIEYVVCYFLIELYEKYTDGKFKPQSKEYECKTNDIEIINNLKETETYDLDLFDIKKS